MNGYGRSQVERRHDNDAISLNRLARTRNGAVAARCAGEVNDDSAALHSIDGLFRDQQRCAPSRPLRGRDDDICRLRALSNQSAATIHRFIRKLYGVTASVFSL